MEQSSVLQNEVWSLGGPKLQLHGEIAYVNEPVVTKTMYYPGADDDQEMKLEIFTRDRSNIGRANYRHRYSAF